MSAIVIENRQNPGCLLQLLWFGLVGWWLGQAWVAVAWFLMVTIIGIPLGIAMLNNLPRVIALRQPAGELRVVRRENGAISSQAVNVPQHSFLLRALYFVLIGWWLTALWIEAAYAVSLTIIGLPLGFWMFDQVPVLLTLQR